MDMMGWIRNIVESIKSIRFGVSRREAIIIGITFFAWKALMCITGSESPMTIVLSGSMEPGFERGDILFLHMNKEPIRAGEIVVFNVDNRSIPIVHRVIKVHERRDTEEVFFLTKGDANRIDDIGLYAPGQRWLEQRHVMGRVVGVLRYVGWLQITLRKLLSSIFPWMQSY